MTAPASQPAPHAKKRASARSCVFRAALIFGLLLAVAFGGLVWGTLQVLTIFKTFTAEAPLPLPVSSAPPQQVAEIQRRIEQFLSNDPASPNSLRLSAADLNALIGAAPGWNVFRGHLHFEIADGRLTAQVTFPLKGLPFVDDRHLNGSLGLAPSVKKGRFSAGFTEFKAGGRALPGYLLAALNQALSGIIEHRTGEMGKVLGETARIAIEGDHLLLERSSPTPASK